MNKDSLFDKIAQDKEYLTTTGVTPKYLISNGKYIKTMIQMNDYFEIRDGRDFFLDLEVVRTDLDVIEVGF